MLIVHENARLLPHFKDVARRFAKEGFVGLAIDLVSRLGGTTEDAARNMMALRAAPAEFVADVQSGLNYLKTQSFVKANALGVTGFCFGGGVTFEMAGRSPDVKAAVPFYGFSTPELQELLTKTKTAVLFFWGDQDRGSAAAPTITEKLRASGTPSDGKIYPGAQHAFFNEEKPNSYNQAAAQDSWKLMLDWFRKYLV